MFKSCPGLSRSSSWSLWCQCIHHLHPVTTLHFTEVTTLHPVYMYNAWYILVPILKASIIAPSDYTSPSFKVPSRIHIRKEQSLHPSFRVHIQSNTLSTLQYTFTTFHPASMYHVNTFQLLPVPSRYHIPTNAPVPNTHWVLPSAL